jgi:hypothetical protein
MNRIDVYAGFNLVFAEGPGQRIEKLQPVLVGKCRSRESIGIP